MPNVDLVVLTRTSSQLPQPVREGIRVQRGVNIRLHRVVGEARHEDASRWETIARARNYGKRLGTSSWLMFLDDDVVLGDGCVRKLVRAMQQRAHYGALAADYLGERRSRGPTRHVAMGATLFRRSTLQLFQFRWEDDRCECQCCCDDLRSQRVGIGYFAAAHAGHLKSNDARSHVTASRDAATSVVRGSAGSEKSPVILTAFDRRHFRKFHRQFLTSLRGSGNSESVVAVGYGLLPSQRRVLARAPGVRLLAISSHQRKHPAVRRLKDFQTAIADLDPTTPVAYWDAGDVVFQSLLSGLWQHVRARPDKLWVAREPVPLLANPSVSDWVLSIRDVSARQRVFDLRKCRPVLNSGFAAGTQAAMLRYLRAADRLHASPALRGTSDWGDQTALNLYCHTNPQAWQEIDEGWNYSLLGRDRGEFGADAAGMLVSTQGTAIHVIHGCGHSLRQRYYQIGGTLPGKQASWQTGFLANALAPRYQSVS